MFSSGLPSSIPVEGGGDLGALEPGLTGGLPGRPVQEGGRGQQWAGRRVELEKRFLLPLPPPTYHPAAGPREAWAECSSKARCLCVGPSHWLFLLEGESGEAVLFCTALSGCGWLDENPVLPFLNHVFLN